MFKLDRETILKNRQTVINFIRDSGQFSIYFWEMRYKTALLLAGKNALKHVDPNCEKIHCIGGTIRHLFPNVLRNFGKSLHQIGLKNHDNLDHLFYPDPKLRPYSDISPEDAIIAFQNACDLADAGKEITMDIWSHLKSK